MKPSIKKALVKNTKMTKKILATRSQADWNTFLGPGPSLFKFLRTHRLLAFFRFVYFLLFSFVLSISFAGLTSSGGSGSGGGNSSLASSKLQGKKKQNKKTKTKKIPL